MKNYEKYAEEIKNYKGYEFCKDFVKVKILNPLGLKCGIGCSRCDMLQMMWLMEEYAEPEEPETDWSKVEVDTPILVRNTNNEEWNKRYFACYENGTIYAWVSGRTSWASLDSDDVFGWKYAKLAEMEGTE